MVGYVHWRRRPRIEARLYKLQKRSRVLNEACMEATGHEGSFSRLTKLAWPFTVVAFRATAASPMDEQQAKILLGHKLSAREQAAIEICERGAPFLPCQLAVSDIDQSAITAYETWHHNLFEFGWERVLRWKRKRAHARALDIAVWNDGVLAGLCWASPQDSHEKILVLYLQRNPDSKLPTTGFIAPLCLSAVRNYALLSGFEWVVVKNPIPEARAAYMRDGFKQVPGVGLAYKLTTAYAVLNLEVTDHDH